MPALSAEQAQRLRESIRKYPHLAEQTIAELESRGYEIDRGEYTPTDWGAEADVGVRSAIKGGTLGLVDPGPSPLAGRAGDASVAGVEFQPSSVAGSLLGMLFPGSAALRGGRALVKGGSLLRGVAQEGVAGALFGAGETVAEVIRGQDPTVGRALETMVADAAGFAAAGLIGRGVLRLFRGAAVKEKAGEPFTPEEEQAVEQVRALMVVRQPLGPGSQLPPSTASGPVIQAGAVAGRPHPLELPPGPAPTRQLPQGVRGPRAQLPPSPQAGRPTISLWPQERVKLPRFTPETADAVSGKPPEVIRLESSAGELARRIARGELSTPQAMQAFYLLRLMGVPRPWQPYVAHKAREAFRSVRGLPEGAGAPVTADPAYVQPVAAPVTTPKPAVAAKAKTKFVGPDPAKARKQPRALPAQMTPYQVIRRWGLHSATLERLYKSAEEAGWHRVHLSKLRGGTQDVQGVLQDVRDTSPEMAQVLDDAGIYTEDDVLEAIRTGSLWKKQSTRPRDVQAEQEFAERPLGWDPSLEGFEERVVQAKSWDDLQTEVERLDDAFVAGTLTPEEVADIARLMSSRAQEIAEPAKTPMEVSGPSLSPAAAPLRGPALEMVSPAVGQPPVKPPQQAGMPLGDVRELPRGARRTSGSARLEDTPLQQAVVDRQAAAERAAAPQGEMPFSGAADVVPEPAAAALSDAMGPLKIGDDVVLQMQDGSTVVGTLARQEAPNTISVRAGGKTRRVDAGQIKVASRMRGIRGGVDDTSGPATPAQSRKLYALEGDLAKIGAGEKIGADPAQMTKNEATARIRQMELLRSERAAGNLDRLVAEADDLARDTPPRPGAVEEGYTGDLSSPEVDAKVLRAAVQEFGPEAMLDPTFSYAIYLKPEVSGSGIRRNPIGDAVWGAGSSMVRDIQKESHAYLQRFSAATQGLSEIDKFRVVKALDTDLDIVKVDPKLEGPYRALRKLLDDVADRLGLEPGERLRDYFPHLFQGNLGRWRAITIGRELGPGGARRLAGKADELDLFAGRLDVAAGVPLQKFFAHVLPRLGVDGFDLDLDKAFYTYLTGAVRKIHQDQYLQFALKQIRKVPRYDDQGRPMKMRRYLTEHVAHAVGQPQASRQMMAKFWADWQGFQSGVDRVVEAVGGAPERGLLRKARRMGELNRKASLGTMTPAETIEWQQTTPAEALNWVQQLVDQAKRHVDGVKVAPSTQRYRADLALAIDDFRAAMGNPYRRGLLAERAYSWIAMSKLGLNLAYGAVNLTQYLTNTVAVLDARYAARGVRNLMLSRRDAVILGGRRIEKVLADLAVTLDTPKAGEFIDRRFGFVGKLQDIVNTPGRTSEQFLRGATGLGAYEQALAKAGVKTGRAATEAQHQAAVEFGRQTVDQTQFPFNQVGTPRALRSPGMRLLLMFQSYPIHQMNFSAELIHNVMTSPRSSEAWGALAKHSLAYATLFGASLKVGENLWDRTQHPAMDLLDVFAGDSQPGTREIFDLMSGPPAAALLQLLHMNWQGVAAQLEPTVVRRTRTAQGLEELLFGSLLQDRPRPARGMQGMRPTQPLR